MPRNLPSPQQMLALLCLALTLAILAPASASASRFGPERGAGYFGGRSPGLTIDPQESAHLAEVFEREWLEKAFWSRRQGDGLSSEHEQEIKQRIAQRWTGLGKRILDSNPPTNSVPEPTTAVLMMLGFAGLAGAARRIRSRAIG